MVDSRALLGGDDSARAISLHSPASYRQPMDAGDDPDDGVPIPATRARRSSTLTEGAKTAVQQLFAAPTKRWQEKALRSSSFTEGCMDVLFVLPLQSMFGLRNGSLSFVLFYAATFNAWLGEAFYNTRFDTDDFVSRVFSIAAMLGVVGMSFGIQSGSIVSADNTFALSYAFIRSLLVIKYCRAWLAIPEIRKLTSLFIGGFAMGAVLWIASAFAPATASWKYGLSICALMFDYGTPFAILRLMVGVHPTHMPERFAAITALVSAGNLFSLTQCVGVPPVGSAANWSVFPITVWGLTTAVMALHLLMYSAHLGLEVTNFEHSLFVKLKAYAHLYLHMPLTMAIESASSAITAADCGAQRCEFPRAAEFELCHSLGAAVAVMALVHATSCHLNYARVGIRFGCGVVMLLLPHLAGKPLGLVNILAASCVLALVQVLCDYHPFVQTNRRAT